MARATGLYCSESIKSTPTSGKYILMWIFPQSLVLVFASPKQELLDRYTPPCCSKAEFRCPTLVSKILFLFQAKHKLSKHSRGRAEKGRPNAPDIRRIFFVAQKRPNKLSKADNILQKTQKLRLRPQGEKNPNGTSFLAWNSENFLICPGDVPELSRRCPGDVPELSRRCPGDVPEVSWRRPGDVPNIPHTWPASFFEILHFWVFFACFGRFFLLFLDFWKFSGFDREIFVLNLFCQISVCLVCCSTCSKFVCLTVVLHHVAWFCFFHWLFGLDWETHLLAWTPQLSFYCSIGFEKPVPRLTFEPHKSVQTIVVKQILSHMLQWNVTPMANTNRTRFGPDTTQTSFVGPLYEAFAAKRTITTNHAPDCFNRPRKSNNPTNLEYKRPCC